MCISRAVVLNLYVVTLLGVVYQISYISDIYIRICSRHCTSEVFLCWGHHNMRY